MRQEWGCEEQARVEAPEGGYIAAGVVRQHPTYEVYYEMRSSESKSSMWVFMSRAAAAQVTWALTGVIASGIAAQVLAEDETAKRILGEIDMDGDDDGR